MTTDTGRSPDGSGSRASREAAKASSPKASIPNAVSALRRQVEDRDGARREGHLTGSYISITPEQAKEIVSYFYG